MGVRQLRYYALYIMCGTEITYIKTVKFDVDGNTRSVSLSYTTNQIEAKTWRHMSTIYRIKSKLQDHFTSTDVRHEDITMKKSRVEKLKRLGIT